MLYPIGLIWMFQLNSESEGESEITIAASHTQLDLPAALKVVQMSTTSNTFYFLLSDSDDDKEKVADKRLPSFLNCLVEVGKPRKCA